jgi:hypothetical protein
MELRRAPVGRLLFVGCKSSIGFLADSVLVPAVELQVDDAPRLRMDKSGKVRRGHDVGLTRLAIFPGRRARELGEQPHATEWDAGAEAGSRFSDKTSATGTQYSEDFVEHRFSISHDKKET